MNNLPWKTEGHKIVNCKNEMIGGLGDPKNNELIVQAVNGREGLIEALEEISMYSTTRYAPHAQLVIAIMRAKRAIKQANE